MSGGLSPGFFFFFFPINPFFLQSGALCGSSDEILKSYFLKVTHNTCSLHLVSNFQNSNKHTKLSIEHSTSLW